MDEPLINVLCWDQDLASHTADDARRRSGSENQSPLDMGEICTMRALRPGTREKLVGSLLPCLRGGTISDLTTFLCSVWDFNTIPYFLDPLFGGVASSMRPIWPGLGPAGLYRPPRSPSFKLTVAQVQGSLPQAALEPPVPLLLAELEHLEPTEAAACAPGPCPEHRASPVLALEPVPGPSARPGPALEPESTAAEGGRPRAGTAPGPALEPVPAAEKEPASVPALEREPAAEPSGPHSVAVGPRRPGKRPEVLAFSPRLLAEQLTRMDAELFTKVRPCDCLGSVWSRRNQKGKEHLASSVRATVAQFNHVANCVITTCLGDPGMTAADRARVVEHWIEVARECLGLRNFSSLHAILSALQSTPIQRLKETWGEVSRRSCKKHITLCRQDKELSRAQLTKMGISKKAALERNPQRAQMRQRRQKKGIVPFLGTFLTDLVMLDTAMKDSVDGNRVNVQKLEKEIKVLQEVQLLQVAASSYRLVCEERFEGWFRATEWLSERQSYDLSCLLEPRAQQPRDTPRTKKSRSSKSSGLLSCLSWQE